jgi:ABC-type dipeptide/oligopeptide/nickel transport system permease subunit
MHQILRTLLLRLFKNVVADRFFLTFILVLTSIVMMSLLADLIAPSDPYRINLAEKLSLPSASHIMGTDQLGRDLFSRILYGGRYTLILSAASIALALVIGLVVGTISGYYRGWLDLAVQRMVDILMAFPTIVLAIALATFIGSRPETLVIAVGIAEAPFMVRVVRGAVLSIREMPYIEAVKLMGYSDIYIIAKHVIPNIIYVVIPQVTLQMGSAILVIAALGFLGIGIRPPTPEWGSMLNEARTYLMDYPHLLIFPGLMIFLSVVSFNVIGESLRVRLDPKARAIYSRIDVRRSAVSRS